MGDLISEALLAVSLQGFVSTVSVNK